MINFDEAVGLIASAARPLDVETVTIEHAAGRILAEAVVAWIDSPSSDVSTMDGYAVRDRDVAPNARLSTIGESFPGKGFDGAIGRGQAVRTFTGAPICAGADRIVIQEDIHREGDIAILTDVPGPARYIRKRASDFACGDTILEAGSRMTPAAMIAAAGADQSTLKVWRRPRMSIISTGDELVAAGAARNRPGMIPDSVSHGISALARDWGAAIERRGHLVDDLAAMQAVASDLLKTSDIVVLTGGASVGERDFSRRVFEKHGLDILFSKVAIKPGKPVWLGHARNTMIVGLPGNPTSALVTARLLLAPLILGMCGADVRRALQWQASPLAACLDACGDRETFARATRDGHGLRPLHNQDSGSQFALAHAEYLVRQPAHSPACKPGDLIDALLF